MRGKPREHPPLDDHIGITPAYAGKTFGLSSNASGSWDHPRVCGENTPRDYGQKIQIGSPPRMRGKPSGRPCAHGIGRITPAYAGKTDGVAHDIGKWEDHPRVCGENPLMKRQRDFRTGSPPRMRGKLFNLANDLQELRITPADAGKTEQVLHRFAPWAGSPPRMRGKRRA